MNVNCILSRFRYAPFDKKNGEKSYFFRCGQLVTAKYYFLPVAIGSNSTLRSTEQEKQTRFPIFRVIQIIFDSKILVMDFVAKALESKKKLFSK